MGRMSTHALHSLLLFARGALQVALVLCLSHWSMLSSWSFRSNLSMFSSSFAAWLKTRSNRSFRITGKANSGWAPPIQLVFISRILLDSAETQVSVRMFLYFLDCSSILGGHSSKVTLESCQRSSVSTLLFLTNLSVLQPSPRSSLMHLPSLAWNWSWTSFFVP